MALHQPPQPENTHELRLSEPASLAWGGGWRVLEAEGLGVARSSQVLDVGELNTLFSKVGFARRDPTRLRCALDHTFALLALVDKRSGKVVGFGRATSDGASTATIWDVVVHPRFQKQGIGRALVEALVDTLVKKDIPHVNLYAEPHVVDFYLAMGFELSPSGSKSMAYSPPPQGRSFALW